MEDTNSQGYVTVAAEHRSVDLLGQHIEIYLLPCIYFLQVKDSGYLVVGVRPIDFVNRLRVCLPQVRKV